MIESLLHNRPFFLPEAGTCLMLEQLVVVVAATAIEGAWALTSRTWSVLTTMVGLIWTCFWLCNE